MINLIFFIRIKIILFLKSEMQNKESKIINENDLTSDEKIKKEVG